MTSEENYQHIILYDDLFVSDKNFILSLLSCRLRKMQK